jgi:hypothetical protein
MDAILNNRITEQERDDADSFIISIIKDSDTLINDEAQGILKDAKMAWMLYLTALRTFYRTKVSIYSLLSDRYYKETWDHIKEYKMLNYESNLI